MCSLQNAVIAQIFSSQATGESEKGEQEAVGASNLESHHQVELHKHIRGPAAYTVVSQLEMHSHVVQYGSLSLASLQ